MKYTFISVYSLIVVSFLGACSHNMINNKDEANKIAVDKNTEFGLIGLDGDCFVTNTSLSNDQDIFLVEAINKPSVEQVKILEKIESCETIYQSKYKYSYSYTEPQYLSTKNTFLIFDAETASKIKSNLYWDLNMDNQKDETRICYENESYIFSIWSFAPLQSEPLLAIEIFLDYDLDSQAEPLCTEFERRALSMS